MIQHLPIPPFSDDVVNERRHTVPLTALTHLVEPPVFTAE
jgi:hypothetical protein